MLGACSDPTLVVGKLPKPAAAVGPTADSGNLDAALVEVLDAAAAGSSVVRAGRPQDGAQYAVSIEPGPLADFCKGTGSPLHSMQLGVAAADCQARVERRLFSYGLCACDQLQIDSDSFLIDSFDSRTAKYAAGQTGGSIGVGGTSAQLASNSQLLGNLLVAGEGTWNLAAQSFVVSGDLKSNAALTVSSDSARVGRDLWLASDITVGPGKLSVDRNAMQAPGHSGLDNVSIAGQRYETSDLRVPKPCSCDDDAPIDVAALVAEAREHNDNAAAGFNADSLNIADTVTDFAQLPCGRLYATAAGLQAPGTYIVLTGARSAVFVQGDLTLTPSASLFLMPIAPGELDIYIAGNVSVAAVSGLSLGDSARPWATRVYVGGEIKNEGSLHINAQLYAPHAALTLLEIDRDADIYGSVYARDLHLTTRRVHYDRAIAHTGPACSAPAPQRCASCNDCPNELACNAGSCAPCTADADCCEPAVCIAGKCQPLVSNWP